MSTVNSAGVNHPTRIFLVFSAAVGIPLNLIRFILMVRPVAVFTLILLIASAIFALTVSRLYRQGAHLKSTFATPITDPLTCLVADITLSGLSLLTLTFTWTHNRWQETSQTFLIAYSSTPLIFNMFLHLYLVVVVLARTSPMRDVIRELLGDSGSGSQHNCPQCSTGSGSAHHDEHDEERALVSDQDDGEERPGSGSKVTGPPSVWSQ